MELQQIIYKTLAVQIEFGVYRFEEQLPTIEEASQLFLVSTDTVRSAYLRLKQDGYITLSRSVGALVKVCYDTEDTDRHIQNFYALRKDALIELSRSMRPLLSYAQWVGFKGFTGNPGSDGGSGSPYGYSPALQNDPPPAAYLRFSSK